MRSVGAILILVIWLVVYLETRAGNRTLDPSAGIKPLDTLDVPYASKAFNADTIALGGRSQPGETPHLPAVAIGKAASAP